MITPLRLFRSFDLFSLLISSFHRLRDDSRMASTYAPLSSSFFFSSVVFSNLRVTVEIIIFQVSPTLTSPFFSPSDFLWNKKNPYPEEERWRNKRSFSLLPSVVLFFFGVDDGEDTQSANSARSARGTSFVPSLSLSFPSFPNSFFATRPRPSF